MNYEEFLLEQEVPEFLQHQVYVINSARYQLARRILARLRNSDTVFLVADEYEEYQELSERMKAVRRQLYIRYPLLKKEGISFFAVLQSLAGEEGTVNSRLAKSYLHLSYQRKKLVCMARNRLFCVCELLHELDIRKRVLVRPIKMRWNIFEMVK